MAPISGLKQIFWIYNVLATPHQTAQVCCAKRGVPQKKNLRGSANIRVSKRVFSSLVLKKHNLGVLRGFCRCMGAFMMVSLPSHCLHDQNVIVLSCDINRRPYQIAIAKFTTSPNDFITVFMKAIVVISIRSNGTGIAQRPVWYVVISPARTVVYVRQTWETYRL